MPYSLADLPLFLLLPALMVGSALFSGSETALFGLTAAQRLRITSRKGLIASAVAGLLEDQRHLLVTLMLGNMLVNSSYFVITSALALKAHEGHPLLLIAVSAIPVITLILIGEVLPKLVANTACERWVSATAVLLYTIHRLARPLTSAISGGIIGPLGRLFAPPGAPQEVETDEFEALLDMSQSRGVIGSDEQQLLREVLQLGQRKVKDVMIPRVDIESIDIHEKPETLEFMIRHSAHTQYIAINGDIDHIEGIIYSRQFWLARRRGVTDLRKLVRQVRFVPEILRVDQLLEDFRRTGTHLAIAVDEYGGTAGFVNIKDVVERMVGDVDMDGAIGPSTEGSVQLVKPGIWRVDGRLSVHDWTEAFGEHTLPPRVSTVGGLVTALLGRMAKPGDRARLANLEMEVEGVQRGRVESVLLRLTSKTADPSALPGAEASP
jgi:CBS domain containing-hemolysin-like protein